ncbi:MAG TPA: phosphoribosyltransferase family protein [Acidimicrobiia bacterium]|nr:phosphoribosyltransferase family protein [Acidimicrobiia bacterium]
MTAPPRVLLDQAALRGRVGELAARIAADHPDGVVLVGVLKGALIFLADLARALARHDGLDVTIDFLAISRYAPDSGRVKILEDLAVDVTGRDVVLVEDLVDTGLTLAYLLGHVRERDPRRVAVCALLDRAERRIVPLELRYVGIEVPGDAFLIGYGLHYEERYRNLPVVVTADRGALAENPDAYLGLYAEPPRWGAP